MPNDSGLCARATGTKDVDTLDITSLDRGAAADDLRVVRESGDEIAEPCHMVSEGVVGIEPSVICKTGCSSVASAYPSNDSSRAKDTYPGL